MAEIVVRFRNAENDSVWIDEADRGSSRTNTIRYDGGFAIITDAAGKETAIPADLIWKIVTIHDRQ